MEDDVTIVSLFSLCEQVNNAGHFYVFFQFSGHVNWAAIHITPVHDYNEYLYRVDYLQPGEEYRAARLACRAKLLNYLAEGSYEIS